MSDFKRIGDFAKVRRGASPRPIDDPKWFGGDIGWVRIIDVTRSKRYLRSTEQYLSPLGEARSVRVDKGDLIMSICATIGRPVIVDMAACIHDGFVQFYDITDADTEYLYYALQHAEAEFLGYGQHGTQANLNTTIVGRHNLFVPPIPQQRKIARILTTIDNLIEKTEVLIAKYQAIKQGMMHDLFTRGVDAHGHLRPPYEEAPELYKQSELGWIPKEWELRQVRDVAETITSGSRGWATYYSDEGAVFVRIGNLTREHINFRWESVQRVQPPQSSEGNRTALKQGDVLVSVTADLGIVGVVPVGMVESYINQHIAMIRLQSDTVSPRWLGRSLAGRMGREQFERLNDSGAKAGLNLPAVGRLRFVDAPRHEQDFATLAIDRFERQIEIEKGQLAKSLQVKTGLMHDLLSGKVRVTAIEAEEVAANG